MEFLHVGIMKLLFRIVKSENLFEMDLIFFNELDSCWYLWLCFLWIWRIGV